MVNFTYNASEFNRSFLVLGGPDCRGVTVGQLTWTDPTTGDSFSYRDGDIAWTLASTALVWIMTPGVGFFYCGLSKRRDALSMLYLSVVTIGVVAFQVSLWSDLDVLSLLMHCRSGS